MTDPLWTAAVLCRFCFLTRCVCSFAWLFVIVPPILSSSLLRSVDDRTVNCPNEYSCFASRRCGVTRRLGDRTHHPHCALHIVRQSGRYHRRFARTWARACPRYLCTRRECCSHRARPGRAGARKSRSSSTRRRPECFRGSV